MKQALPIFLALAWGFIPLTALADDATRNTQIQLKNRGFYYGKIDGVSGSETEAAVRRFQIRQGLKVTGTLNEETSQKLNRPLSASAPAPPANYSDSDRDFLDSTAPAPSRSTPAPTPRPAPPRYTDRVEERDERYLPPAPDGYRSGNERFVVPPPVELTTRGPDYADIFRDTIFENASRELQQDVLRDAQARLARLRYYAGAPDGLPGPLTEDALADFQDDGGRRVTGRLDMPTLSDLGLISRRRSPSLRLGFEIPGPGGLRIFRGIEIER